MADQTRTATIRTSTDTGSHWAGEAPAYAAVDSVFGTSTPWITNSELYPEEITTSLIARQSQILTLSAFGFSLPAGEAVTYIAVDIVGGQEESRYAGTNIVDILATLGGDNKAREAALPNGLAGAISYAGTPDWWGLPGITGASVNDAGFSFAFRVEATGGPIPLPDPTPPEPRAWLDRVQVTISTGATPPPPPGSDAIGEGLANHRCFVGIIR
jgi:hypothetical protein